jgi:hypothetical protein
VVSLGLSLTASKNFRLACGQHHESLKEISCSYKTFVAHVRRLQRQTAKTEPITPKKRKEFTWDSTPNKDELI